MRTVSTDQYILFEIKMYRNLHTLMYVWHVESGSPTRLTPFIAIIWSPMFSWPHLAAAPEGARFAITTVGNIEPQPDSTITTPRISPFAFGTTT